MVGLPHDCSMGKIEQPHATSMLAKRHQKSVKNSNCKGFLWPMADISTTFQVSVENYTNIRQSKQKHTNTLDLKGKARPPSENRQCKQGAEFSFAAAIWLKCCSPSFAIFGNGFIPGPNVASAKRSGKLHQRAMAPKMEKQQAKLSSVPQPCKPYA